MVAVARIEGQGPWMFLDILALFDSPRPDSKETIACARGGAPSQSQSATGTPLRSGPKETSPACQLG
jgi:hypothetical protein